MTKNYTPIFNNFYFITNRELGIMLDYDNKCLSYFYYSQFISSSSFKPFFSSAHQVFTPRPSFFYPYSFYSHIKRVNNGFIFGAKFKVNSPFYSFFVGLYLYVIWLLGGGYRILPIVNDKKTLAQSRLGFYDLRFTPLAVFFSWYLRFFWLFGLLDSTVDHASYLYNHDIFRGPLISEDLETWNKNQRKHSRDNFFSYLLVHISFFLFLFPIFLFFSFLFHFFFVAY